MIFAFPFFLTIPGWIALGAYRRWQRGERDRPAFLIGWGITMSVGLLVAVVAGIIAESTGS